MRSTRQFSSSTNISTLTISACPSAQVHIENRSSFKMQGDPNLNVQHPYMPFPPGASYYSEPRNNHPMASLQGVPLAYGDSFSYHDYSPPLGQTQLGQAFTANAPPYHYFPPVIDPPELTKDNLSTQTLLPESQSQPGSKGRRPCVIPRKY